MCWVKCKPKNLTESLLPISIINWIFGHQIIQHLSSSCEFLQSIVYFIFVVLIYGTCLSFSVPYFFSSPKFSLRETVYMITVCMNILILSVNLILGRIYRNKSVLINKETSNIDKKLKACGVKIENKEALNFSIIVTVIWMIMAGTINSFAILWNLETIPSLVANVSVTLSNHHPIFVNHLIDLVFCLMIRNIGLRFKNINQVLSKFQLLETNLFTTNNQIFSNRENKNNRRNLLQDTLKYNNYVLEILKDAHLELSEVCNQITEIFGLQILMTMASSFILLTSMFYNLYLTIFLTGVTDKTIKIFIILSWIIGSCLKFMFTNHTCSKTVDEWKNAGVIIHKLETKSHNPEFLRTIQQFSIQMIQNPLTISPCGILELGYSFVQGFFGTITTYLVILIQMVPTNTN
ncbi:putative gustatory receptor 28b [Microplitis mediator]|uniref:putative gustatory receptor 28b n=1 Tax=Microplitis mediator TaxID=375433 RepID=UPI0025553685|nr:putative gustatory receptor 28b [Microplitis mediator]